MLFLDSCHTRDYGKGWTNIFPPRRKSLFFKKILVINIPLGVQEVVVYLAPYLLSYLVEPFKMLLDVCNSCDWREIDAKIFFSPGR